MKKLGFILVLVLILASLVIAACGGGDEEEAPPTATEPPGTQLELPDTFKFTMEYSSTDGDSGTYKYWVKDDKWKVDMSGKWGEDEYQQIMICDGEYAYIYDPESNTAMKYPSDSPMTAGGLAYLETFESTYADFSSESAIKAACDEDPDCISVKKAGTETISGHKCDIWEGTSTEGTGKVWVATDTGWPLKFETTYGGETMTMEYTELDMNPSIPDSVFQLPAGVEIMDMSSGFDFGGDEFEWPEDFDFE